MSSQTAVFHRHTKANLPNAIGGDGVYILDDQGNRIFDACGGAAVSCLGHSHPVIKQALKNQIDQIAYAHTAFFTTPVLEELAQKLINKAPGTLSNAYILSGGSEAVESAIKLARQYFLEKGDDQRYRIIARRQSYHGNTVGALSAGGNMWRRTPFSPILPEGHHIAPCYAYRDQRPDESEFDYGQRVANELEEKLIELGPETVMAFIAEPVVGATAGAVPAVKGYFKRIREICDQYGILLILDEIMCGMGRTGTLFACEQEDIAPDMVTIAKGLGAGYGPISALLTSREIFDTIRDGSGFFQHGHTYLGHPLACAAALATQKIIEEEDLLSRVRHLGGLLMDGLKDRFKDHPYIGDIRGRGLFQGIEFVENRETKTPFAPESQLHTKIKKAAFARGLMVYPMAGTIDGKAGHHLLLAPPFIMNDAQVSEIIDLLDISLQDVFRAEGKSL